MLYLVLVNEHYYPGSGTQDWHLVTDNENEAREYFDGLMLGDTDAYLIRLSADGYAVVDHRAA